MVKPARRRVFWHSTRDEDDAAERFWEERWAGGKSPPSLVRAARAMRQDLSEEEIDRILADSFPASDPPQWY